jgi:hypothetical protein
MRLGWLEGILRAVGIAWIAAEVANILDALSTWIVVVVHGGTEQGLEMAFFVKLLGTAAGIVVGKLVYGLLVLGVAITAMDIPWPQLQIPKQSRRWVIASLWAAAADWGYGAAHNFLLRKP